MENGRVRTRATLSTICVLLRQAKETEDNKVTVDESFLVTVKSLIHDLAKENEIK